MWKGDQVMGSLEPITSVGETERGVGRLAVGSGKGPGSVEDDAVGPGSVTLAFPGNHTFKRWDSKDSSELLPSGRRSVAKLDSEDRGSLAPATEGSIDSGARTPPRRNRGGSVNHPGVGGSELTVSTRQFERGSRGRAPFSADPLTRNEALPTGALYSEISSCSEADGKGGVSEWGREVEP